jgi:hypothetical protein
LDAAGREPPFLLLPAAVSANPSPAMVASPSVAGQWCKAPIFGGLGPPQVRERTRPAAGCRHTPEPTRTRRRAANLAVSSRRVAPPRRRAPVPAESLAFSSSWRALGPIGTCRGLTRVAVVDPHRRRALRHAVAPLRTFVEHLLALPKTPGSFLAHVGPHVALATEDPGGSRAAGHPGSSHTVTRTVLRRSESRRDPVRPATPTATWAAAGLKATHMDATSAPVAGLQISNSYLKAP